MLTFPHFSKPSTSNIKCIAVLTSGGDAPGMNAAIRAVVRYAINSEVKVLGIQSGYRGLLAGKFERMGTGSVANIIQRGGTILKSARCPEFHEKKSREQAANILRRNAVNALVVIGGDGSFTGAHLLENETGFPVIGVPGTIDNDIFGTDMTIGFDTAVNTALDGLDRIRDTAGSHDRLFLVEVMGRSSGFIAMRAGIAGGAETVLIPEKPEDLDHVCQTIDRGVKRGKTSSLIVVAEGAQLGNAYQLGEKLTERGYFPKVCVLGHIQRGGTPSGYDRLIASALGAAAVGYLLTGESNAMVGIQSDQMALVPFKKVIGRQKPVASEMVELAKILAK